MDTSLIEAYAVAMTSQPQMTELEVIADGIHVRLRRSISVVDASVPASGDDASSAPEAITPFHVTAQSVGVFVPAEPAFVVGDFVDGTRALGAIDTVGITNAIVSPVSGVISAVHVEAGQPVEYGQNLFDLSERKAS
ncbi:MAG: acetyl-CoA carboxylase biotin carboxyl carrier protein [Armatimonadota bacterium]